MLFCCIEGWGIEKASFCVGGLEMQICCIRGSQNAIFLYLGVSKLWFCCKVGHRKYIFVVYRAISKMQFCVGGHENAIFSMIMGFWILAKFYPQLYRWHLKCFFFVYVWSQKCNLYRGSQKCHMFVCGGLENAILLYRGISKIGKNYSPLPI